MRLDGIKAGDTVEVGQPGSSPFAVAAGPLYRIDASFCLDAGLRLHPATLARPAEREAT